MGVKSNSLSVKGGVTTIQGAILLISCKKIMWQEIVSQRRTSGDTNCCKG